MAIPSNASVVVAWGFWVDEITGLGVKTTAGTPATVTLDPVTLDNTINTSPNLRDIDAQAWIKTRRRTATVNATSGYFAAVLVASDDPDLDAYRGRRVSFYNEAPFTVAVPYDAPVVTVDGNMAAATGLSLGSTVRGLPLTQCARVEDEVEFWLPEFYLNAGQVNYAISTAIATHNTDPSAHPGLVVSGGGGGGGGSGITQAQLDNAVAGHVASTSPHPVYDSLTLVNSFEGALV
jgi:hypothetical protein